MSLGLMESRCKEANMHLTADLEEVDSGGVVEGVVGVVEATAVRKRAQRQKIVATRRESMTLSQRRSHADRGADTTEVVGDVGAGVEVVGAIAVDQEPVAKGPETSLVPMEMTTMKVIAQAKVIEGAKAVDEEEVTQVDDHEDSDAAQDGLHHKVLETKGVGTVTMTMVVINTRTIEETGTTLAAVVIVGIEIVIVTATVIVTVAIVMGEDLDVEDMAVTGEL